MPATPDAEEERTEIGPDELSSWSFIDRIPTTQDMLNLLATMKPVHGIEVKDYAEFVLPLTQDQKFKGSERGQEIYKPVTKLYCQVAGRVKMLNDAAEKWGWTVGEKWKLVHSDPITLRIGIVIVGNMVVEKPGPGVIHGNRYGVSKAKGGDSAWEKMETAARGRAIAAWGFGVLPGSGIASLEEMQDALFGERTPSQQRTDDPRSKEDLIGDVRGKIEQLRLLRGQDSAELDEKIQAYVKERLGQTISLTGNGLDLAKMKPGNLLLLEADLKSKIAKEEQSQSDL